MDIDDDDYIGVQSDGEDAVDEETADVASEEDLDAEDAYVSLETEEDNTIVDSTTTRAEILLGPKTTSRMMSKYEKTVIIGVRTRQLQLGAKPLVDIQGLHTEQDIALRELKERRLPLVIKRTLRGVPPVKVEYWRVSDLIAP
jgi:DNA-directed RNA polymerase I, II, and III subunit RPABC2